MRHRARKQAGDTIVEVVLALSIFGAVLGSASVLANRSTQTLTAAQEHSVALRLAQAQLEYLKQYVPKNKADVSNVNSIIRTAAGYCIAKDKDASNNEILVAVAATDAKCTVDSVSKPTTAQPQYKLKVVPSYNTEAAAGITNSYVAVISAEWESPRTGTEKVELVYRTYEKLSPTKVVTRLCDNGGTYPECAPGYSLCASRVDYTEGGSTAVIAHNKYILKSCVSGLPGAYKVECRDVFPANPHWSYITPDTSCDTTLKGNPTPYTGSSAVSYLPFSCGGRVFYTPTGSSPFKAFTDAPYNCAGADAYTPSIAGTLCTLASPATSPATCAPGSPAVPDYKVQCAYPMSSGGRFTSLYTLHARNVSECPPTPSSTLPTSSYTPESTHIPLVCGNYYLYLNYPTALSRAEGLGCSANLP